MRMIQQKQQAHDDCFLLLTALHASVFDEPLASLFKGQANITEAWLPFISMSGCKDH